jgi:hypothetical protein
MERLTTGSACTSEGAAVVSDDCLPYSGSERRFAVPRSPSQRRGSECPRWPSPSWQARPSRYFCPDYPALACKSGYSDPTTPTTPRTGAHGSTPRACQLQSVPAPNPAASVLAGRLQRRRQSRELVVKA